MSSWLQLQTEARSIARRFHLIAAINWVRGRLPGGQRYEAKFGAAVQAAVREGDTVWDVGANVGLYTRLFSQWVGPHGRVVAIEPVPTCFALLESEAAELENVTALNLALGDREATLPIRLAEDLHGATHSLVSDTEGARTIDVRVCRGDSLPDVPPPNVIKVDVEGYEPETIQGLDSLLGPKCRAVLCEIHFGLLESRGRKHAPAEIEAFLAGRGFAVEWIDGSHLGATRRDA